MTYFAGKIKNLHPFRRKQTKVVATEKEISVPLAIPLDDGDWARESREALESVKKLRECAMSSGAHCAKGQAQSASAKGPAQSASAKDKKDPEPSDSPRRFHGRVKRKKRKGKKRKGATPKPREKTESEQSPLLHVTGLERNKEAKEAREAFPVFSRDPAELSEKPVLEMPLLAEAPFDFRFLEFETHFSKQLRGADFASLYFSLESGYASESSAKRVSSFCSAKEELRPNLCDLESIIVCYVDPDENLEAYKMAADTATETTADATAAETAETEAVSEAEKKPGAAADVGPGPVTESEPETGPVTESEPETEAAEAEAETAVGTSAKAEPTLQGVYSVRQRRVGCEPLHEKYGRQSLEIKSLLSHRESRESLLNLCGISFESTVFSGRNSVLMSFKRLDIPRKMVEGEFSDSALIEAKKVEEITEGEEEDNTDEGIEEVQEVEDVEEDEDAEEVAEEAETVDRVDKAEEVDEAEDVQEAKKAEEVEEAEDLGEEVEEGKLALTKDIPVLEPQDKEKGDAACIEYQASESAKENGALEIAETKVGNVFPSTPAPEPLCTKMEKDWWEFDSDEEKDAAASVDSAKEEKYLNIMEGRKELPGYSSSEEDKESLSEDENTLERLKLIFRKGNKSLGEDLFSQCFDDVEIRSPPSEAVLSTYVEDSCLYKMIFPEEKEPPFQFQTGGFIDEINSFAEKSSHDSDKEDEFDEAPIPLDEGKTNMSDVKNAPRLEEDPGQEYIESCQQIFVNGTSFWMQTELLLLKMEEAVALPIKEKKREIKFEEEIDAECPQIRITCEDDAVEVEMEENDLSKWDLRLCRQKKAAPKLKGCLRKEPKVYLMPRECHLDKVGFKILANLMENVENMGKKLGVRCKGRKSRQTILSTLKEFELILLNVKHFEATVNYESIILYIKRILRLRRKLGEILSLTCGLQTEYVLVAEAVQDEQPSEFDRHYWMQRLQRCIQAIRLLRKLLRRVKAEIHEILKTFTEKTGAILKQSRKILKMRDDLLAQYQNFILMNHINNHDLQLSLEALKSFKEFLNLYSTICTDGFKRLLWDDINVLDKLRMIFENMNKHFGESIKRQQLTLRGLRKPNELDPNDHKSKHNFRRELSLLKKKKRTRRRKGT